MLNEGQFAGTGGWVLKPEGYRGDSAGKEGAPEGMTYTTLGLKVEFLAAQELPMPKDDSKPDKMHPYATHRILDDPMRANDATGMSSASCMWNICQRANPRERHQRNQRNKPSSRKQLEVRRAVIQILGAKSCISTAFPYLKN